METGGRPEFGVCAAVDVHYLRTGGARAAAVLAADAAFAYVLAERTTVAGTRTPSKRVTYAGVPASASVLPSMDMSSSFRETMAVPAHGGGAGQWISPGPARRPRPRAAGYATLCGRWRRPARTAPP